MLFQILQNKSYTNIYRICRWEEIILLMGMFDADGDGDEEKLRDNQHQLGAAVQKLIKTRTRPLRQQQKKRNHLYSWQQEEGKWFNSS